MAQALRGGGEGGAGGGPGPGSAQAGQPQGSVLPPLEFSTAEEAVAFLAGAARPPARPPAPSAGAAAASAPHPAPPPPPQPTAARSSPPGCGAWSSRWARWGSSSPADRPASARPRARLRSRTWRRPSPGWCVHRASQPRPRSAGRLPGQRSSARAKQLAAIAAPTDPTPRGAQESTCGAGDSLVAGAAAALLEGAGVEAAVALGMAVARRVVQSRENAPRGGWDRRALGAQAEAIAATARRIAAPAAAGAGGGGRAAGH